MKNESKNFKTIQNHLAASGYVFQGSEIYGGLANTWDYGPLGVLLNNKIKKAWWKAFITKEPHNFGLDTKIIMNPSVWEASGHLDNFSDPLVENKTNGKRYRADKIVEELFPDVNAETMPNEELHDFLTKNVTTYEGVKTNWSKIREFHLMFETKQGVVEGNKSQVYLRPETAQGIFVNFKNVQRAMRTKLPFGIGQIGKSFRNEVTPGNFIFRTREFEQMELEFFINPQSDDKYFEYYVNKTFNFVKSLGIKDESVKLRPHEKDELAHYSKATTDIEFMFPFGWGELSGISNRTDFDLKAHMNKSGESLEYLDPTTNQKIIPYVIEPSMGIDRLALAVLIDAYEIDIEHDDRIVLKLDQNIAPYKVAVMPLSKKHHSTSAKKIFDKLLDSGIDAAYDETGSIGKRYRRQDSIGTPFVITVIDETERNGDITLRFRDTMEQIEINFSEINKYLKDK